MISPTFYDSALKLKHFGNHGLNGGLVSPKTDIRHVDHL